MHKSARNPRRNWTAIRMSIAASAVVVVQGCGDPTLVRLGSDLAEKANGSSGQVQIYYAHLNKANRDLYQSELDLAAQPELKNVQMPPATGLTGEYPPSIVESRVKMSELLTAYCDQIYQVAVSKTSPEVDDSIKKLNTDAQTIGGQLFNFAASAARIPTAAISTLVAPFKTLASLGWQGAFAIVRINWALKTISERDAAFEEVCQNIYDDLTNSTDQTYDRARNVAALTKNLYDRKVKAGMVETERQKLSAQLIAAGTYCDSVPAGNPAANFKAMKDTFHALSIWAAKKTADDSRWQIWRRNEPTK